MEPPFFKRRQLGFERMQAEMMWEHMRDLMFGPERNPQRDLLNLAIKIIEGDREFTPEELQLQANEPEELEKTLRELNEWLSKRKPIG